jgi:hypothetical protein
MSPFANIKEYVDALNGGAVVDASIRKVPSQASTAGMFVDLSMASGNPKPQYYAAEPFVAATLDSLDGIYHGTAKSPSEAFVAELMLTTPTTGLTGMYTLQDYLLFYPFIELDNLDTQTMDNTVTLPRYADGDGVQIMMVAQAPTTGGETFTVTYVNQDGVERTTPTIAWSVSIASIPTQQPAIAASQGMYLPLASGDSGVRSITSVQMIVGGGGLAAFVLVRPLMSMQIFEVNTPSEKTGVTMSHRLPRVYDGAYLNLVMQCNATVAAGTLAGRLKIVWDSGE